METVTDGPSPIHDPFPGRTGRGESCRGEFDSGAGGGWKDTDDGRLSPAVLTRMETCVRREGTETRYQIESHTEVRSF